MQQKLLYNGQFLPMTTEIAFLRGKPLDAMQSYVQWITPFRQREESQLPTRLVSREVNGDLASVLSLLPPLTTIEQRRMAFVPTKSEWTAYFENKWPAADIETFASIMSERLRCQGVRVCFQPPLKGKEPATILCVFPPDQSGGLYERALCAAREGRWEWSEFGKPYDFEEVEKYKLPRIKDRFTQEMMIRYLHHFGIDAFEESFYCRDDEPSYFVEAVGPAYPGMHTFTLEDARNGNYPWKRETVK